MKKRKRENKREIKSTIEKLFSFKETKCEHCKRVLREKGNFF
jgi:ribosomal protein L23